MIGWVTNDPFVMLSESGRALAVLAIVVPLAVLVFAYGWRQASRSRGDGALRPRGRTFVASHPRRARSEHWRETVRALEGEAPTPITSAVLGPVRVVGVITRAAGDLGGRPGRECVWRNKAGARPDSAVGAEAVFVRDDTGECQVDRIETAYVIAPEERVTQHHEFVSLYVGDRVEVFGSFAPARERGGPADGIYGTIGTLGPLDVRLVERTPPTNTP